MEMGVLGPLTVTGSVGEIALGGGKERTVLAFLVARVGQVVPADELVDAVWPDDPPRTAQRTLQSYVARLRAALDSGSGADDRLIQTQGRGYRLALDPGQVDAHRFTRLVELARTAMAQGQHAEAADMLRAALDLWRGPAYAGFELTKFGRAEARRLTELRTAAQEDWIETRLAAEGAAAVVPDLEAHVTEHPLRERGWALLVRAHAACDNQAAALAALERARCVLAEELGVDPGAELRELQSRVLAQDPSLMPRSPVPSSLVTPPTRLVGRERDLDVLRAEWDRVARGEARRALLLGAPGSGRWRLASELAAIAAGSGGSVTLQDHQLSSAPRPDSATGPRAPRAIAARRTLRVVDARAQAASGLPDPAPGELQLVVAGLDDESADLPADTRVHTTPLSQEQVLEVLGDYSPGSVDRAQLVAVAAEIHARSAGHVGRVQELAIRWARDVVSQRVAASASRGVGSTVAHEADLGELADGVQRWSELATTMAVDPGTCPWPGLAHYREKDAAWFSGRERLTAELVARVGTERALLLVGGSGSGKSSLLRAGLLASLAAGALPGSAGWVRITMRPGEHPMRELTSAALTGAGATGPDRVADLLSRSLDGRGGAERILVVVDQFEESWTACADPGERAAFLDAVAEVAARPDLAATVVLAVRADHAGRIADHAGLAGVLAGRTVFVGPMGEGELRRAIEGPAARAGLTLDTGLVDALVADTLEEPGGLPLLSTALADLWDQRTGNRLALAAYVGSGGVSAAIARMAERAFSDLDAAHQRAARVLMRRLAGPGEGDGVVRRRVVLDELAALPDPLVSACVDPLAQARMLTVSQGSVEVAHEALFRSWPRLREWLAEDAVARDLQRRLAVAAVEWDQEGRERTGLWAGARLAAAADLVTRRPEEFTGVEVAFIEASTARLDAERVEAEERARTAQRQNSRLRRLLVGLGVTLALALVAGGLAVVSRNEAAAQGRTASAQRLAATAATEDYIAERMLRAVEAVRTEESPQTVGALLSVLDANPAVIDRIDTPYRLLGADAAPGSTHAVAVSNIEDLHWFDMTTGVDRVLWSKADANLSEPRVSPDGRHVAFYDGSYTGQRPARLTVVDATSGQEVWSREIEPMQGAGDPGEFVALNGGWDFTDTPGELAVALTDGVVLVDLDDDAHAIRRAVDWEPVEPQVGKSFWLGDDRLIVLGGDRGAPARLVDVRAGTATELQDVGSFGKASTDGRWLLTQRAATPTEVAAGQAPLRIIDLDDTSRPAREVPFDGDIGDAGFTPDGRTAAVGSRSGDLVIIDLATGEVRETMAGAHNGAIMGVVVSPDGSTLWTAGRDGDLLAWDLDGQRRLAVRRELPLPLSSGSVADDGRVAQVWMANGWNEPSTVAVMDLATGELLVGEFPVRAGAEGSTPNAFAGGITPSGSTVLIGWTPNMDDPARLRAVDVGSGDVRFDIELPWWPNGVDATGDEAFVAGVGGVVGVDLASGEITRERELEQGTWWRESQTTVEVSPDGRSVAVSRDHEVLVLDARTLETITAWPLGDYEGAFAMAWLPDSSAVAFGGTQGRLYLRSVGDGRDLIEPRLVFPGWVTEVVPSPDGALVAAMGGDGEVVLLDTRTGEPIGRPLKQGGEMGGLGLMRFAENGQAFETFSDLKRSYRYPIDTASLIARACRIAAREPTPAEWASMHGDAPQRPTCGSLALSEVPVPTATDR